jgi:hypothetical protein
MKRFALAVALACVLSVTALAGEVPSTGAPNPGIIHMPSDVLIPGFVTTILSLAF